MIKLNVKSSYSLLSSTLKIHDIINYSLKNKKDYAILSDTNVLFGIPEFVKECQTNNIKPIIGMEFSIVMKQKKISLLTYAKDDKGYLNLIGISSLINSDNINNNKDKSIEFSKIVKLLNHLVVIVLEKDTILDNVLTQNLSDLTMEIKYFTNLSKYKNDVYFGISNEDIPLFNLKNKEYIKVLNSLNGKSDKKNSIKIVPVETVNYLEKNHESAYKILCAMLEEKDFNSKLLEWNKNSYFDYKINYYNNKELYENNITNIINNCNVEMKMKKNKIPHFENTHNLPSKEYLRKLCVLGLKKRFFKPDGIYIERLKYEIDVITKMGFEDYFLIVYDLVCFARKKNIYVGVGRGSVVGSLVAYCLGITNIDPLKYGLVFERFLNPERISLPDIDLDFEDIHRDKIVNYAMKKYGFDKTSKIITFDTFASKRTLIDVGKVLEIDSKQISELTKLITKPKSKLIEVYNENDSFKRKINSSKIMKRFFELCLIIEGNPKNISVHPAGVLISSTPIIQNCPTIMINGITVTQYQSEFLEELGLIKMDCLSLSTLSCIHRIVNRIQVNNQSFNLNNIPLNDSKVLDVFKRTDTLGIFQMESTGMQKLLSDLQPESFNDLIAAISLYRPGPMNNIPLFIKNRKLGKENISYPHSSLEEILKDTYGIMIYQEQIMWIARKMANFSLSKADHLRKAIAKKNTVEMHNLGIEFKNQCMKNGYDEKTINEVFNLIERFAEYGFNKSHAVAYAIIAYQLAYLKTYYPLEFFCETFNSNIGKREKTIDLIVNAKKYGIYVFKPDINISTTNYDIISVNNQLVIKMPVQIVKNLGTIIADKIIKERNDNGFYQNLENLMKRFKKIGISKNVFLNIIDGGLLNNKIFSPNGEDIKKIVSETY